MKGYTILLLCLYILLIHTTFYMEREKMWQRWQDHWQQEWEAEKVVVRQRTERVASEFAADLNRWLIDYATNNPTR